MDPAANQTEREARPSEKKLALFLFLAAAVIFTLHVVHFDYTVDDAFISLRYAENLIEGRGPVMNPGERVEGYTNPLWVLVLAASVKLGADGPLAFRALSFVFSLGALALVAFFSRLVAGEAKARDGLAAVFVALNGSYALWAAAGLENGMLAMLLLLALIAMFRESAEPDPRRGAFWGALFFLCYLTRPDAALFMAAAVAARPFLAPRAGLRPKMVETGAAVFVFALLVAGHLGFRLSYYGEWWPNTFHAKAGLGAARLKWGFKYLLEFFEIYSPLALIGPALLLVFGREMKKEIALLFMAAVYAAYVVFMGGDRVFPFFRFFMALVPLLFLSGMAGFEAAVRAAKTARARRLAFAAAAVVLFPIALFGLRATLRGPHLEYVEGDKRLIREGRVIGLALSELLPDDATVAAWRIGVIPYYSGLRTIDLLGLTEPAIARAETEEAAHMAGHAKHDFAHALSKRPEAILYWDWLFDEPPLGLGFEAIDPSRPGFQELSDPAVMLEFRENYDYRVIGAGDGYIGVFVRNDLSRRLGAPGKPRQSR